ncbi:hypothetical protein Tco_1220371, partial [Tanacetum coccineum]
MPPTMMTRRANRPVAASQGGETGGRAGRGGGRTRGRPGDQVDGRIDGQGGQVGGQGSEEFLACNPKKYDGKGGAIVYTRWIEKMELVQDMSGCRDSQKVKYIAGSFVGKALTWWNSQIHTRGWEAAVVVESHHGRAGHAAYTDMFHELARLVPHLVTPEDKRIE